MVDLLSQSRRKFQSKTQKQTKPTDHIEENKNSNSVIDRLDTLRSTTKREKQTIPRSNKQNKQLLGAMIIIVVGISGIIIISQLNTSPGGYTPPTGIKTVKLSGNFYMDTQAVALFDNGKLVVIYEGAEFCPYCAVERWAIVMALQQFGTFTGLTQITTPQSEGSVPTYSFVQSSYTSTTLEFQSVELDDVNHNPLQTPTTLQSNLMNKYDPSGSIPFMIIGGTIFQVGAGQSLIANAFSGKSFTDVQTQVNTESGTLYNQIQTESQLIVTYINQLISQHTTTTTTNLTF